MTTQGQFEKLFENKMEFEEAREFLIGLYTRGESGEDIAAAARVMRSHSIKLPISSELQAKVIDVVGTGGDKSGSFNISSTVSLLLASMGSYVAKHGNRSITSNSGSADLLEALGINLNLTPEHQITMLEECGFCFIFAMNHHPAMKHIMPIRKSIEHRTIFNLLGPLTNPAGAKKYMLGVFSPDFIDVVAEALVELGASRAYVVSSDDLMDELSLATTSQFAYVEGGRVSRGRIDPRDYGYSLAPKEAIQGGDAIANSRITRDIFAGIESGAKRDIVTLNASFALFADGKARDLKEAKEMVIATLESKKALSHLAHIIKTSQQLTS